MRHPDQDDLTLLALGEPAPAAGAHVATCAACAAEVQALSSTVVTARAAGLEALPTPPPWVWERVVDELRLSEPRPAGASPVRRGRHRAALVAAVLTAAAAVAVVATVTLTGSTGTPAPGPSTPLVGLAGSGVTGRVALADEPDRRSLLVTTAGLPAPDGRYEVWLIDVGRGRLVSLGDLDDSGRGWVTLPVGVDLDDYPQVDISREPDDRDPGHSGDSVLRGDLPARS